MSGIINSLGNLVGGNAAKTDRKFQLQGFGDLGNVFNFGLTQAKAGTAAGQGLQEQAGRYYGGLLSGDRPAVLQAVAPTTKAVTAQTDAAKRNLAQSGTARGGGVASTTQGLETQKRSAIDQAINQARSGAAGGAASVGATMADQAARMLGIAESTASTLASEAGTSRELSDKLHRQKVKDAANLADTVLAAVFG